MQSKVDASGRVSGFLSRSLSTKFYIKGDTLSGSGFGYSSRILHLSIITSKCLSFLKNGCSPFDSNS
jgi:hypothetical protein